MPYVPEWIDTRQNLSPYTQKMELSALRKLFQHDFPDVRTKTRVRAEITRSRGIAERDKNFSVEKNQHIVTFCRCTGLRRAELQQIRCGDICITADGSICLSVERATKGGRPRLIRAYPVNEIEKSTMAKICAAAMIRKSDDKIFDHVPSNMDVHSYRAEYCQRVYNAHARDIRGLPASEVYICRKDRKGVKYDRKAMLAASNALGHSRISVIAGHYLR